jgi:phosphoglycerate dehydrogenase-like enzyme
VSTKKVVVADAVTPEFSGRWKEDLDGLPIDLVLIEDPSDEALRSAVAGADVLITRNRPVDGALLDAAGDPLALLIKLSRWAIGIDIAACQQRGVHVEHVPQLGCITVAEHAMTFLLMCARDMVRSHLGVVSGAYREHGLTPEITSERSFAFKWIPVTPFELHQQTLGIVGFGEIGKELAVRARSFDMTVLYFDQRRPPADLEKKLGVEYAELDDLLAASDFISLHIPHTPATEGLISAERFRAMKPSAYLINACRGGVIDEEAMVDALRTGEIAGAGLDVFVYEPLPHDHPLTQMENVILSPHIGGGAGTGRADQRERIRSLIQGGLA